ncbi:hypothetical protein OIV83_002751 [Microbotryomycetes sp. JL201]|nr:hypothetical protein OIV83_002751 [Microbotryomycetes sp. JL201]
MIRTESLLLSLPSEVLFAIATHLQPADLSALARTCRLLHSWTVGNEPLFRSVFLREYDARPLTHDSTYESDLKQRTLMRNVLQGFKCQARPTIEPLGYLNLLRNVVEIARQGYINDDGTPSRNIRILHQLLPADDEFVFRVVKFAESCLLLATVEQAVEFTNLLNQFKCFYGPMAQSFQAPHIFRSIRRTYTAANKLFGADCSVQWLHVEATRNVLVDNVRDAIISEDWGMLPGSRTKLELPGSRAWSDTATGGAGKSRNPKDWAGVELKWVGTYAFIDFQVHSLINSPAFAHTAIPPAHLRRQGIGELLTLEMQLADCTEEPTAENPYPQLLFTGKLVTPHAIEFPQLTVQGSVTRGDHEQDDAIRWLFTIMYEGRDQWILSGLQIGQERSKMGVMGTWQHASTIEGAEAAPGPVGPFWWFVDTRG